MITTVEELEALPVGSVIKSKRNTVLEKGIDIWWAGDNVSWTDYEVATHFTPATLLIPNTISQETALTALHRLADNYKKNGFVKALDAVLETLGIEVSDV